MNNFKYDSKDEEYFHWLLLDLEKNKLVSDIQVPPSFKLFDGVKLGKFIIRSKSYTPDFKFKIDDRLSKFFYSSSDGYTYVDVKGDYTKHLSSSITFPDRQAMMWMVHNIYVNKIIPHSNKVKCLFKDMYTPSKFVKNMQYKNKLGSKITYPTKTIKEFLNELP